ncbi:MAG TPA: iron ABC transporter permease, partial [Alteromonas mediterranea]|nr:iron ABC transporter permease [Alteromonas mediterranea]
MQLSSAAKHSDNPSDYPSGNLGDNPSDYSSVPVVLQLINARAQRKRIGMGILLLLLLTCAYVGLTRGSLPIDIEQQLRYFISG